MMVVRRTGPSCRVVLDIADGETDGKTKSSDAWFRVFAKRGFRITNDGGHDGGLVSKATLFGQRLHAFIALASMY